MMRWFDMRAPVWRGQGDEAQPNARLRRCALLLCLLTGCAAPSTRVLREDRADAPITLAAASGEHGAVSSAEPLASDVGRDILRRGGNAVDAAVAVGFALGVTHPSAGNLGGGGFMLIRLPDETSVAIDYREIAPGAAHPDMFLNTAGDVTDRGRLGPLAAGIPGVVAGLAFAHRRFGRLPWSTLLEPAIQLARDGHVLDPTHAEKLQSALARIAAYATDVTERLPLATDPTERAHLRALADALESTRRWLCKAEDCAPYRAGERWDQPELARTLARIAAEGADAFYAGPIAQAMVERVAAMGGIWTDTDLESYRAIEREPIAFDYHGHRILTMPPPSAGGVVLRQIFAASDALQLSRWDWDAPERIHLYIEILRRVYADRNQLIADPAFVTVPLGTLLDPGYMLHRLADIDAYRATPSSAVAAGLPVDESPQTTHFSVVDANGMAVANTYTLNAGFGALVAIPGTGVLLNNEMDDFTAKPGVPNGFGLTQGRRNAIAPGKRMLSSMTPTIVLKGHELRAVLGSPGGPTITTTVAQLALQLIDYGRSLQAAIAAPRIHHQWLPDEVLVERGVRHETLQRLRAYGHHVNVSRGPGIGHADCIERDPHSGVLRAVADVDRGGGGVAAY